MRIVREFPSLRFPRPHHSLVTSLSNPVDCNLVKMFGRWLSTSPHSQERYLVLRLPSSRHLMACSRRNMSSVPRASPQQPDRNKVHPRGKNSSSCLTLLHTNIHTSSQRLLSLLHHLICLVHWPTHHVMHLFVHMHSHQYARYDHTHNHN